ncbi:hypothetical protein E8E13_007843 [Curvularia kusanoi]|uniref:Uncharacterized protein n=1 Tax=Curvularia kusanoi TaxID=90978 RepID=A0A9P4TPQ7_CURKU|nr:hypothetical protein E8E13_007843 [Curvularia kusanoi]
MITLLTFAVAAPAEPSSPQDLARSTTPPWNGYYCGTCILTGSGGFTRELRTSVPKPKCNILPERENYGPCFNNSCGLCVMFKNDDCQGDITYFGGKGAGSFDAKGARSYFCM